MSKAAQDQYLKASLAALENCMKGVVEDFEDDERDQALERLRNTIEGYCLMEDREAITAAAIQEAKQQVDEQGENVITFMEAYNNKLQEKEANIGDMKMHPKYIAFEKKIAETLAQARDAGEASDDGDSDDEVRVTEAAVNTIDPISQQAIMSPVKNKICGHSYEKTVIMQYLKRGKKIRCPYAGCRNDDPFGSKDIVEDEQMKEILRRQRAK